MKSCDCGAFLLKQCASPWFRRVIVRTISCRPWYRSKYCPGFDIHFRGNQVMPHFHYRLIVLKFRGLLFFKYIHILILIHRCLRQNIGVHWGPYARSAHALESLCRSFLEFSQRMIPVGKTFIFFPDLKSNFAQIFYLKTTTRILIVCLHILF